MREMIEGEEIKKLKKKPKPPMSSKIKNLVKSEVQLKVTILILIQRIESKSQKIS